MGNWESLIYSGRRFRVLRFASETHWALTTTKRKVAMMTIGSEVLLPKKSKWEAVKGRMNRFISLKAYPCWWGRNDHSEKMRSIGLLSCSHIDRQGKAWWESCMISFQWNWAEMKLAHDDVRKPAKNHSTQVATMNRFEYVKVALRHPKNNAMLETRMRYEVTRCPWPNSRSSSVDKYFGHGIDSFAARYHTTSIQSDSNSHKRYFGMSLRVSYDPRRKRLHKN